MKKTFEIIVPREVEKQFVAKIKEGVITDIKHKKTYRESKSSIVVIEPVREVNEEDINLGILLSELKTSTAAKVAKAQAKKKAEAPDPIVIEVDNDIVQELRVLIGGFIVKTKANKEGGKTKVFINVSEIRTRKDLVKRLAFVFDSIHSAQTKHRNKRDLDFMRETIKVLNKNCSDFMQTKERFRRVKGKQLIKEGYADIFDLRSKTAGFFQKIFLTLFKKRNFDYFYFGQKVQPEEDYVIELKEPLEIEPKKINHAEQVALYYDFGEQMYFGNGVYYVDSYFKNITNKHNKLVAKLREETSSKSKLKVEK